MQKKTIAKKEGNKKMSILLVLKALEVGSSPDRPIKQIDLAKMVNDLGGELNADIWCDRKTVGRHIKLLSAAGYKIVFNKGKGYYLESSNFDLHETELLKSIIAESNISDAKKQALVRKLINQQHNPTKTSIRKFLREETK